ncbi:ExbD/TolR family protein [Blastopirellula marina]|uniref:Biopolymer transporter ExbD n=1 Tax=Blastopirellula marina TaxID=124 RepID=A0A2S8FLJ9_9BACT|nr:biopolymer transporter ExbD [Blastopirellula marina]PQO33031.1 biopolymer transporter ExbD [Blastopirellula marina]PTL43198.1 biopolymer transporter ExbD [Blastopirellula marina]
MRVPTNLKSGQAEFNMTPMIDVVFLLIIFFLVSSHLAKQEAQLPLPLPTAKSGQEILEDQQPRVVVNIGGDGSLSLGGHRVPADQLKQRLIVERERSGQDLEVRIRCDRQTPFANVKPVMLAAAQAGIWNVAFSVIRPEDAAR